MNFVSTDNHGRPAEWHIVFLRRTNVWWLNWIVPGRFKHVRAFGYVPETDCWIFYEVGFQTTIRIGRGLSVPGLIASWVGDGEVLIVRATPADRTRTVVFTCTSAMANLIGAPVRCVAPDVLHEHCLRHGARRWHRNPSEKTQNQKSPALT